MNENHSQIPPDIQHDLPEAPYQSKYRMLRGLGWSDEEIKSMIGVSPDEQEAEKRAAAAREKQSSRHNWWTAQWVPFATLVVACVTLIVSILALILR